MEKCIARTKAVVQDNPLKMETMIGAQASVEQMEKIKSYLDLGKKEGAKVLAGGAVGKLNSGLEKGNYIQPTIFETNNKSRISQEEIFGPVVSVIKFKDDEAFFAWYDSPEYKEILPIRLANSRGEVHLLEEQNLNF